MNNGIDLVDVRRTDAQLLAAILWRAWHRIKRRIACKISLWNYVSYNRMKGRNVLE